MLSLGGKVLGVASAESSSASKGETVADTVRVVSCYSDIIRHAPPQGGRAAGRVHARAGPGHHAATAVTTTPRRRWPTS